MADENTQVEPELKLESPNMDEQSAAPKEVPVEIIPDKEKVGGEAEPKAEAKEPEAVEAEEVVEQTDWKDKELKRKHAQIKERDRQLAEQSERIRALEELAQRATTKEGDETVKTTPTQNMSEAQIQAAARQIVDQQKYQDSLASINAAGEKSYGKEWVKSLENLATLGTVEMPTMKAILATDAPEKVLMELGKNPNEYLRIMDMEPERRANEFAKLALKQAPKKAVSSAPEPVESVRGRVTPSALPSDSDDDATWYAKWEAHQAERRKKSA